MPSSRSRARNSSTSARTCSAGAPSNSCSRPCVSASASAASGSMRHRAAPVSLSVSMPLRSSAVFPAGTSSVSPAISRRTKSSFTFMGPSFPRIAPPVSCLIFSACQKGPFGFFRQTAFQIAKQKIGRAGLLTV